jgi:hypothetical protein
MLGNADYAVVPPKVDQLRAAVETWRMVFSPEPMNEEDAEALRTELAAAGARLEVPCRQARLLAQAALASLKDVLEETQLAKNPKRRTKGESDPDTHALLEQPPPDPAEPTPEERAELEGDSVENEG